MDQPTFRARCPQCQETMVLGPATLGGTVTCDNCLEEFEALRPDPQLPEAAVPSSRCSAPENGELEPSLEDAHDAHEPQPTAAQRNVEPADRAADGADLQLILDDLPAPPAEPKPPSPIAASDLSDDFEFTVTCPLCATRLSVTHVQIGKQVECPDCFSSYEIRTPPRHARRRRTSPLDESEDDEFRLSDPVERPKYEPLVGSWAGLDSESEGRQALPADPDGGQEPPRDYVASGTDAFRRAEQEVEQTAEAAAELPDQPLTAGTIGFLFDLTTLGRLVALGVALQIEAAAIQGAADGLAGAGVMRVAGGLLFIFSFAFGLVCFVAGSVSMLAITEETAGGRERIESWPAVDVVEWFYGSLHMLAALAVGSLPGLVIGQLMIPFGARVYAWGLTLAALLSVMLLFPFLLIASLETGFPINFASRPVFRSLTQATPHWSRFYLLSGGLVLAAVAVWQLRFFDSLFVNLLTAFSVVAIGMVYFRMLGRLVWACQEASE